MAGRGAHRIADRDEDWAIIGKVGREEKFFQGFTNDRSSRVFSRLDMTARWQPQPGIDVVDEKQVFAIDDDEIRDQMFWWRGRFLPAAEFRARTYPSDDVPFVLFFVGIKREDIVDFALYCSSHGGLLGVLPNRLMHMS